MTYCDHVWESKRGPGRHLLVRPRIEFVQDLEEYEKALAVDGVEAADAVGSGPLPEEEDYRAPFIQWVGVICEK